MEFVWYLNSQPEGLLRKVMESEIKTLEKAKKLREVKLKNLTKKLENDATKWERTISNHWVWLKLLKLKRFNDTKKNWFSYTFREL